MKIKEISRIKGRQVITVRADATLAEAIEKLVNNRIGAMPAIDAKGTPVGIISERDILKWLHKGSADVRSARVKDIMTTEVIVGDPEDDIENILKTMTERGVRHLPVMSGASLVGILSLRDVIQERLTECDSQVRYLNDYIAGGYT
ncbi:MAG: CBS domain-containing protein [Chloroflexota bacterium]